MVAKHKGLYAVAVNPSWNTARLEFFNKYAVMFGNNFQLMRDQPLMWVMPKTNATSVKLSIWSPAPSECVLVQFYNPNGEKLISVNTKKTNPIKINIPITSDQRGKPWSLSLTRASEDMSVNLSNDLLPMIATHPKRFIEPVTHEKQ